MLLCGVVKALNFMWTISIASIALVAVLILSFSYGVRFSPPLSSFLVHFCGQFDSLDRLHHFTLKYFWYQCFIIRLHTSHIHSQHTCHNFFTFFTFPFDSFYLFTHFWFCFFFSVALEPLAISKTGEKYRKDSQIQQNGLFTTRST